MNYYFVILIAFALAMDAFAVSMAGSAYMGKASRRQKFRLSFHFGLFQFLMPIIGWFFGTSIVDINKSFDHWLAFIILLSVGLKIIYDSFKPETERIIKDISKGYSLVTLSVATSIDALAVGFSFGIMGTDIILPSIIIGVVASSMSLIGIKLGEELSHRFGEKAAIAGGVILIFIGLNILREHLEWF